MKNKDLNLCDRPWGKYYVLDVNKDYKIKRIEVNAKSRLSYQFHNYRSETWIILNGTGVVTIEGNSKTITKGDIIEIPQTFKHRVENTEDDKLIFIEVQTGTYFGEDDIIRYEDNYGREDTNE